MDHLETLMISGQQSFKLHLQINPIYVRIDNDRVVNTLKTITGVYYIVN